MADEKNLVPEEDRGDIVIYQTDDGGTKIDVRFEGETVWLTQQQMAELFGSSRTNIVEHIRSQPVGNSDKFAMREADRSQERSRTIISI